MRRFSKHILSICFLQAFCLVFFQLNDTTLVLKDNAQASASAGLYAAQGDNTFSGRADAGKALRAVYGNYDARQARARWTLSPAEVERFEFGPNDFADGRRDIYVKTILSRIFRQNNVERYIVITEAAPPHYSCHACAPIIGGALFSRSGNLWKLDVSTREIMRMGSYGVAPADGTLVRIGPSKYGVLFRPGWSGQGYTYEGVVLLGEISGAIKELVSISQTGGENGGTCGGTTGLEKQPCWSYQSRVDFVPRGAEEYYDLRLRTTGTKADDDGKVRRVRETKRYSFAGGIYEPSR